jgi:hypothetical protein
MQTVKTLLAIDLRRHALLASPPEQNYRTGEKKHGVANPPHIPKVGGRQSLFCHKSLSANSLWQLSWVCQLRFLAVGTCLALTGCHVFNLNPAGTERKEVEAVAGAPSKYSLRIAPYVFLSDSEIPRQAPMFREVASLRDQVTKELRLPTINNVIQVYLFENQETYERFMQTKYPKLPKRRAFFVAQPRRFGGTEDLLVYTYWGDRVQQDLRHELTHALLHSVLKDVPLWLDEGLAEFFEVPRASDGLNSHHVEQLRRGPGPRPNLARLEQLSEVDQMTPGDYREAWAWVHLMLRSTPEAKQVLISYIGELRTNPRPGPLGVRLAAVIPGLDTALERHLAKLPLTPLPRQARGTGG